MRGDRLRTLREAANLTQEALAAEIESSEPQIWRYENADSNPRADVLVRLAGFFSVSVDYLLGLTDNPSQNTDSQLRPREAAALSAWRRGERFDAIKVIVDDD